VEDPPGVTRNDEVTFNLQKYVVPERPIFVSGIYQQDGTRQRYEAITVYLLHSDPRRYLFEETHWWLVQTTQMADRILDHLFDAKRSYSIDDFSKFYRTNLNILGQPMNETVQECAVLSRLIYDLSSAYLMTGAERYFLAARAAVNYLREAFRSLSHDGDNSFCQYFKILQNPDQTSINVLPDFMPPGKLAITRVRANGIDVTADRKPANANDFQVSLQGLKGSPVDGMIELVVEFGGLAAAA
jgi:hypothetical protein